MPNRVLIDGRLLGYRYGGIASYVGQLARHTPVYARDLDISIVTTRKIPEFSDRAVRAMTPPHHRLERFAFGVEVDLRNPDLLHSVDYVQPRTRRRMKHVVTIHDLAFLADPGLITPDSWDYYSQIIETVPQADRVITVSEWTRTQLLASVNVDAERVVVVPNGYDDDLFVADAEAERDELLLSQLDPALSRAVSVHRPIVLGVGTIEPRKRFGILVDAFDRHFAEIERLVGEAPLLVIAGQAGWLADETISRLRKLMAMSRAVWARDVRDQELAALYRCASLLVMPSVDEGFGLPVLEAMASGTPSLTADLHAVKEIVQDNGFLEESSDPARWAEKIARIIADREIRERRGRRGIERATSYSWRETARRTVDVYRGVLSE